MLIKWEKKKENENVVHVNNKILIKGKNSEIMKYLGKLLELKKNIPREVTQTNKNKQIAIVPIAARKNRRFCPIFFIPCFKPYPNVFTVYNLPAVYHS